MADFEFIDGEFHLVVSGDDDSLVAVMKYVRNQLIFKRLLNNSRIDGPTSGEIVRACPEWPEHRLMKLRELGLLWWHYQERGGEALPSGIKAQWHATVWLITERGNNFLDMVANGETVIAVRDVPGKVFPAYG